MKSCEKLRMHFIVGIGPFVIIFTLAVVFYLYIVRRIFEYVIYIVRRIFEYVKYAAHIGAYLVKMPFRLAMSLEAFLKKRRLPKTTEGGR